MRYGSSPSTSHHALLPRHHQTVAAPRAQGGKDMTLSSLCLSVSLSLSLSLALSLSFSALSCMIERERERERVRERIDLNSLDTCM